MNYLIIWGTYSDFAIYKFNICSFDERISSIEQFLQVNTVFKKIIQGVKNKTIYERNVDN